MKFRTFILDFTAFLFLGFGIAAIVSTLMYFDTGIAPFLWFCYIGLFIISIGIMKRDGSLIASQLCILAIPYVLWNIDFFFYVFTGQTLFGIVDYFFIPGPILPKVISAQHLFALPFSLLMLYFLGLKRKDFWKISIIEIIIMFFITRFVTTYSENVNCVYQNCARFDLGLWYPIEWFAAYALMISLTAWTLTKMFYKK